MVAAPLSCVMPAAQPSAVNPPPPTIATSGHDAVRGTSSRGRRKWQRSLNDWRLVGQFRFSNLCVWFLLCMCCSGAEGSLRMATPSCCTQGLWSQRRLTVLSYICNGALLARCVSLRGWLLVTQKNFLGGCTQAVNCYRITWKPTNHAEMQVVLKQSFEMLHMGQR